MKKVYFDEYDITPYVQNSAYQMENVDIYDEWKDGNHITHRHIYRQKVLGHFECVFTEAIKHDEFLEILRMFKDKEGKTRLTVYLPALADHKEIMAYLTVSSVEQTDLNNGYMVDRVAVEVEEA